EPCGDRIGGRSLALQRSEASGVDGTEVRVVAELLLALRAKLHASLPCNGADRKDISQGKQSSSATGDRRALGRPAQATARTYPKGPLDKPTSQTLRTAVHPEESPWLPEPQLPVSSVRTNMRRPADAARTVSPRSRRSRRSSCSPRSASPASRRRSDELIAEW